MDNQAGINLMRPQHSFSRGEAAGGPEVTANRPPEEKVIVRILDKIFSVSLFALFLGLPLFFTNLTFQGLAFEKQIYFYFLLLLSLVVWTAKGVLVGELKIRRTPLDIPLAIFWLAYLLSTIFSVDRWHSFWGFFGDPSRGFMNITALIIAYYLIMSNFSQKVFRLLVTAILVSGSILTVWTVLGVLGVKFLPTKLLNLSPFSLIGSVSGLGAYLSALVPLFITAIFQIRAHDKLAPKAKNIWSGILTVILALDILALFALYAFVPWIAVLVGIGFFLIFILARVVRPAENWTWLPMVAFVLVLIVMMIGQTSLAKINLPVEVSPNYQLSWQIAKTSLQHNLLLGSGAASYGYDFSLYRPQEFNLNAFYNLRFYQASGLVFEAISTLGIVGTLTLIFLILSFISVALYLLATQREKDKTYSLGFVTATLLLLYAAVTARTESTLIILGALIGTLALAFLLKENQTEEKYLNLSLKASPKYALALAFVFMVVSAGVAFLFVFLGKVYLADVYAGLGSRQTQITESGSIGYLIKAISLNGKEGRYFTQAGQQYMVLANNETLKDRNSQDVEAIRKDLNNSIAAAVQGKNLMPKDVMAQESLGQVYENAGLYVADSLNLANDTYTAALALEPHNPNLMLKLGMIKEAQALSKTTPDEKKQLVNDAKGWFQKAIDDKANFAAGFYQLSLAKEALGDLDGAVDDMQKAFSLDNSNINFAFNLGRLFQARGKGDDNKNAESLFKQILGINDKEINTHFSLAMLYEKTNRKSDALTEYQKVLDLLPAGSDAARTQIQKMIDNVRNGVSNFQDNSNQSQPEPPAPAQP